MLINKAGEMIYNKKNPQKNTFEVKAAPHLTRPALQRPERCRRICLNRKIPRLKT